jgi:hypothetical protein
MRRMKNAKLGLAILGLSGLIAACGGASERAPAAAEPGDAATTAFSAPGGGFSVEIPAGWESSWTKAPTWDSPSQLMLFVGGKAWIDYVAITVLHFENAARTAERYLYDQKQAFAGRTDATAAESVMKVAGRDSSVLEVRARRSSPLEATGEAVPAVVRHVVVPATRGYFVLRYDAPAGVDNAYRTTFDRVLGSFAPGDKGTPIPPDPVPYAEYQVYAALFASEAPGGIDSPQFFDAIPKGRLVEGATMALDKPLPAGWPGKDFGPLDPGMADDYRKKNASEWPLTDRILVPWLRVMPPDEISARLKEAAEDPTGDIHGWMGLDSSFITLSRVGFSAAGDRALLSAAFTSPGAMRAQYLIVMNKTAGTWRLERAAMEDLIYH